MEERTGFNHGWDAQGDRRAQKPIATAVEPVQLAAAPHTGVEWADLYESNVASSEESTTDVHRLRAPSAGEPGHAMGGHQILVSTIVPVRFSLLDTQSSPLPSAPCLPKPTLKQRSTGFSSRWTRRMLRGWQTSWPTTPDGAINLLLATLKRDVVAYVNHSWILIGCDPSAL